MSRLEIRPEYFRRPRTAFSVLVATGLGTGFSPVAPGTAGSLLGLALLWRGQTLPLWALALLGLAILGVGTWATREVSELSGSHDASSIVIDEVIGMGIAALPAIGHSLDSWILAFVLFRFFDVVKPGPIRWIDRHSKTWTGWKGAAAVMGDDLLAGFASAAMIAGLQHAQWIVR
jgi:phosphatidylglycerophosphatase A